MWQHPEPNARRDEAEEEVEELGTPIYGGSGLSVRALTAAELQRFLDAHHGQPAQPLGSGWNALHPPGHALRVPQIRPEAGSEFPGTRGSARARPGGGSLGSPGRSALAQYRRRRAEELTGWARSLIWRAPLVAAAGVTGSVLAAQAGVTRTLAILAGLAVAGLVGWRLRFRPSEQARAWRRGAHGERETARVLDRLGRDGYVVLHDLAMPGSSANVDHLVLGPSGVFVIDSKQWTGQVHQSSDELVWHNQYRLDRTLASVRWQAETLGRLLGIPVAPVICVHGAQVQHSGLRAQGVAIVPTTMLCLALGDEQLLSEVAVELYATTARMRLRPASSAWRRRFSLGSRGHSSGD